MELLTSLLYGLISLLVIVNPIGAVPVFISLSENYGEFKKKVYIWRICKNMFIMLAFFSLIGIYVLNFFGLGIAEMKISGGLMLLITAWKIATTPPPSKKAPLSKQDKEDITFSPMVMPVLAGPATIARIIDLNSEYSNNYGFWSYLMVLILIFIISSISLLTLKSSTWIRKVLLKGNRIHAFSKIMSFFILAIAIKLIMEGIKNFYL